MSLIQLLMITVVMAVITYFVRHRVLTHVMVLTYLAGLGFIAFNLYEHLGEPLGEYFYCDRLGFIFLIILIIVSVLSGIHYITFVEYRNVPREAMALHNAGTIFFTGAITGVLFAQHFGVLWTAMEATTLGASILIYHNRNQHSLEATWKYVFIASIGIAIAFAGILFLGLAAHKIGHVDFTFAAIKSEASRLNPVWLKATFLLVLTGFSVKMSLVPLFTVDIDAKDASPSLVGATLSSVLMNAGFIAMIRFYDAFSLTSILPWMNNVLLITGMLSLVLSASYLLKVRNIKRLFAYSSMEHASLVTIAFSCGGIGYLAAILHLIMHSFAKASLFLQVSQMHRIYNSKWDESIGSYLRINPLGGLVLLLGFLSIIAMPPSGMLITELMMFQALVAKSYWWLAAVILVLVLVIIYGLAVRLLGILFIKKPGAQINMKGATPWESVLQLVLIVMVFYIGLFRPEFIVNNIQKALEVLPL